MKNALLGVGAELVGVAVLITAIFGIANIAENNWEQIGDGYCCIYRVDSPFSYTEYQIRWSGPDAGLQAVCKTQLFLNVIEAYADRNGDGKVDKIYIDRTFGRDLYLTAEDRDNPAFAKEFLKADLILLQAKLRFFDKVKEAMESLQSK